MKRFTVVLAVVGIIGMLAWVSQSPTIRAYAQEITEDDLVAPDAPEAADNTEVFVIVCDAKPSQWLVLDSTGKWIPSVRAVDVTLTIGDNAPKATCTMWSGPIRPKNPIVKNWTLAQLKSVTEEEFSEMLDSLQDDPEAIRRRIAE